MIKCITFDLDDTLWAVHPVVKLANMEMLEWLKLNAPLFKLDEGVAGLNQLRKRVLNTQPDIKHSVTRIRTEVLRLGLQDAGYSSEEADQLAQQSFDVFYRARQQVEFFEHALSVVEGLKAQGYLVGAISNGNASIHHVGLSHCMDFQFNADEVGVEKPDPEIFSCMLRHTGLKPEQVIHIGDHPVHDIEGAKTSGLWSIWVNLDQRNWDGTDRADEEVACLSEIPEAVQRISQIQRARL